MRVRDIQALYDYHYWANRRILDTATRITAEQFAAPAPVPSGSLRGTLIHTLGAERSWLARWEGRPPTPRAQDDESATVASLAALWQETETALRAYLASLDDDALDRELRHTRSSGQTLTKPLWQTLVHVVNHGTQHRSEAAMLLTIYGASPGDLDFSLWSSDLAS
jgi:uncharacterized damage-inducible protein DinB